LRLPPLLIFLALASCAAPEGTEPPGAALLTEEAFFDGFEGPAPDAARWEAVRSQWGRGNGGVVPENVSLRDGLLQLEVHGDRYRGPVQGLFRQDGVLAALDHGRRVGAVLITKRAFSSGRFEVRMKVAPVLGACSALWTYLDAGPDSGDLNQEIDIELPGRPSDPVREVGFRHAICSAWRTLDCHTSEFVRLDCPQDDGEFHLYRFDWHPGGSGRQGRVDFFIDGKPVCSSHTAAPDLPCRFQVGVWCPEAWAGMPEFDVSRMEVDWVRITPWRDP